MNKKYLCLLLTVLLFASGCAGTRKPDREDTENTTAKDTEVSETVPGSPAETFPGMDDDPGITVYSISRDLPFSINTTELRILGFQRYDSIEGKNFTDTPGEGNCYLVLFLSAGNYSFGNIYLSPDEAVAAVDGEPVTNTFLLNSPKEYNSFFNMLYSGNRQPGFIVWEAPSDWRELSVRFLQWQRTEQVRLETVLTPEDYFEPPELMEYYYQY